MKKRKKISVIIFFISLILLIFYFISILPVIISSKRKIKFYLPSDVYKSIDELDMTEFSLYDKLETGNIKRYYYKSGDQKLTVVYKNAKREKINLLNEKYIYTFEDNKVNVIDEQYKTVLHYKDGKFINCSLVSNTKYLGKSVYVITYYNIKGKRIGVKTVPMQYSENNKMQNFFFVKYFNAVFARISEFDFLM